jgi:hypothetical protein
MLVSELLATKLIENEFVAYQNLRALMDSPDALSKRGFTIATYALCGFANLGSLGIQVGVLSGLAPSRARVIARIAPGAMIAGFISTLQAAVLRACCPNPSSCCRSMSADVILGPLFCISVQRHARLIFKKRCNDYLIHLACIRGHMTTITGLALLYFPIAVPVSIFSFTFPNRWK